MPSPLSSKHAGGAPLVIAHRGASAHAPENTLAAFALAADMHADSFELDCSPTRDGRIVVIHDDTLDRTTSGAGSVAELDFAAVRAVDAGGWKDARYAGERIPTLAEALALAVERRIGVYIEVKCRDSQSRAMRRRLARGVAETIDRADWAGHTVVQSFSPRLCAVMRAEAPYLRVALLGEARTAPAWLRLYARARWIGCAGLNVQARDLTPARIRAIHRAGMTVAAWTVDDEADMLRLARWGVDGIITNRPDVCRKTLGGGAAE